MTWLKLDDGMASHPKWLRISAFADSLWLSASLWCAQHNNDGVIPAETLDLHAVKLYRTARMYGLSGAEIVDRAVVELVAAELWRRRRKAAGGGWEIVNWLDYQPSRQQVEHRQETSELHRWLHKSTVGRRAKAAIVARDRDCCRYCGQVLAPASDHRSPARRTFDVIDPDCAPSPAAASASQAGFEAFVAAVVCACGWCNAVKGRSAPGAVGLELRPVPIPGGTGSNGSNGSRPIPGVGSERVGSERVGSERVGSGHD